MLKINNLSVSLKENNKEILKNINIEVKAGEVHLLSGRNGSGKSSLVSTIMGNPDFKIESGMIEFFKENITESSPNERSLKGIYLANQYPTEIPGVPLMQYLRLIYNIRRSKEDQLPVFKFKKLLEEKAEIINYPKELLRRNLNEGFSGGEKKKTEILQLFIIEPKLIMLDEVDSGLDKASIHDVFCGLAKYKKMNKKSSFLIITHYDKCLEYLKPDFTHEMSKGELV